MRTIGLNLKSAEKMSNKMWGGRFESGPGAIMEEINASIGFDYRLARQDIEGSKAHVAMLATNRCLGARATRKRSAAA